jgi:hypothetical protein
VVGGERSAAFAESGESIVQTLLIQGEHFDVRANSNAAGIGGGEGLRANSSVLNLTIRGGIFNVTGENAAGIGAAVGRSGTRRFISL